MFGTVIADAYKKGETTEMAAAIDDLCSPTDSYGWASAGIYCFWDYITHEAFYIGLASDLHERFMQHNGMLPIGDECCKHSQIEDYFNHHEKLGYTIFVQSPLSQPLVHRNKATYKKFASQSNAPVEDMLSEQGKDDIKRVEGILIEAYRQYYGHFPPWNKVGGSIAGQKRVLENNINIVKSFSNPQAYKINPIVARSTLRELFQYPEYEGYESYLHAVRMYVLILGMDYMDALAFANKIDTFGWYQRMVDSNYINKELIV